MPSERSAHVEHDSPGEQDLRREVKLVIEHSQASVMNAMREMMAEFTRNHGRSESGSAEGSAAVGQIPRGIVPAAVRETPAAAVGMARDIAAEHQTNLREGASPDLGVTGRGGTALPVEVGPPRGQPDQSGTTGEWGAYPGGQALEQTEATGAALETMRRTREITLTEAREAAVAADRSSQEAAISTYRATD